MRCAEPDVPNFTFGEYSVKFRLITLSSAQGKALFYQFLASEGTLKAFIFPELEVYA